MPRDLFDDVAHPRVRVGTQKWYTVPLSVMLHVLVVGIVVGIPLMAVDVLPTAQTTMTFLAPPPTPPSPPPPPAPRPVEAPPPPLEAVNRQAAPIEAPITIAPETGLDIEALTGIEASGPGSVVDGVVSRDLAFPPPPPPQPPAPVRVGGNVQEPRRTIYVAPTYPPLAQAARVEGVVILEAVIDPEGHVTSVKVLRSVPLLDDAAVSAVEQWIYSPTLLNDLPVPVIMTVTVQFMLQ